jgi:small subunit ribosomal protein S1
MEGVNSNKQAELEKEVDGQFERMLEEYSFDPPKKGEIMQGEIISVDEDTVLVDVGGKRDAVVPRRDLNRLEGTELESLEQGDRMPVEVIRSSKTGGTLLVSLSSGLEQEDWDAAHELLESGELVESEVIARNRGGVEVQFGRLRGFVPNSHIAGLMRNASSDEKAEYKKNLIGTKLWLKMLEVDRNKRRLVLSGRSASNDLRKKRLEELEVGEIIEGRVVNLVKFGAFVDLGGVDGLVHISELDWQRVDKPSDVLEIGEQIQVKVKSVDVERQRVGLSRKAVMPSPWDTAMENFKEDQLVEGEVTNVVDFGAFVAFPEGIEGLIHRSEMEIIGPGRPEDVVRPGDRVLVKIVSIDRDEQRIGLSMRQVPYNEQLAWMEKIRQEEDAEAEMAEGEEPGDEIAEPQAEVEVEAEAETEVVSEEAAEDEAQPAEAAAEVDETAAEALEEADAEAQAETEVVSEEAAQDEAQEVEAVAEVEEPAAEAPEEADVEAEAEAQAEVADELDSQAEAEPTAEEPTDEEADTEA